MPIVMLAVSGTQVKFARRMNPSFSRVAVTEVRRYRLSTASSRIVSVPLEASSRTLTPKGSVA